MSKHKVAALLPAAPSALLSDIQALINASHQLDAVRTAIELNHSTL